MNIETQYKDFKLFANNLLKEKGVLKRAHFNTSTLKTKYPLIFDNDEEISMKLYMIINDIDTIPICKECGSNLKFKDFSFGFRKNCSTKCAASSFSNTKKETFSSAVSKGMELSEKFNSRPSNKHINNYTYIKKRIGNDYIIDGYCKHGEFTINANKFTRLKTLNKEICEKCIEECEPNFDFSHEGLKDLGEKEFKFSMPNEWRAIQLNCEDPTVDSFSEKKYMHKIGIKEKPLCPCCKKNKLGFKSSYEGYNQKCDSINCKHSASKPELEIYEFVSSFIDESLIVNNKRTSNIELDLHIPHLNKGIEFNGIHWHAEAQGKDYKYHINKKKFFGNLGIEVTFIWEDDWLYKKEICKSIIQNMIGFSKKIYARKTKIRQVSEYDKNTFLIESHLQGACNSKWNLGLYEGDELVSLMTFGNTRFEKNEEPTYELLRFCNKKGVSVVGGASKLLNHFRKLYNGNIVSYANLDISNGNLYKKLGFDFIKYSGPSFWIFKGMKRHNRAQFQKHLIDDGSGRTANEILKSSGYNKVWNCGSNKYLLKAL